MDDFLKLHYELLMIQKSHRQFFYDSHTTNFEYVKFDIDNVKLIEINENLPPQIKAEIFDLL